MQNNTTSQQIDDIIANTGGWKAEVLSRLRKLIKQTEPGITEEVKWKTATRPEGLPVWSHNGIVCIAETWKDKVVLIFFKGVHMTDPKQLFNARLKSSTDRAIEFREGDNINETALKELILEAVEINNPT